MRPPALLLAPLMVLGLLAAPATATATPVDCARGIAAGGYPATHLVPNDYAAVETPGGIFPWEAGGYNHGQRVGAANLTAAVDAHAAACSGPIYVRGHSYGAAIVHTALETIDGRDYADRVHVHLTGNPRHPGGIEDTYAGLTLMPGVNFRGAGMTPHNVTFVDECNYGRDYICHAPHLLFDPLGALAGIAGYLGSGHSYS